MPPLTPSAARVFAVSCVGLSLVARLFAAESSAQELFEAATRQFDLGNRSEAIELSTQAVRLEPTNATAYFVRGRFYELDAQPRRAVEDFTQAIALAPDVAMLYQHRGTERFKLSDFTGAIEDFDRYLARSPDQAPHHWQRGIAYYYAGQFVQGRQQFELHQTVNRHDVENAVWHFLCVARISGLDQARRSLIPIEGDPRVPMKEIHALFAGQGSAEDVLKVASAGELSAEHQRRQLFYAHLYLGLYYEATGDPRRTLDHLRKAAEDYRSNHSMGDVARVHLEKLLASKPVTSSP